MTAQIIVLDPARLAARAKDRAKILAQRERVAHYRGIRDRAKDTLWLLENADSPLTGDELLRHYGHVPQPGEWFQILRADEHAAGPTLGEWFDVAGAGPACFRYGNLVTAENLVKWPPRGPDLYLVEGRGSLGGDDDKTSFSQVRLMGYIGRVDEEAQDRIRKARMDAGDKAARILKARAALTAAELAHSRAQQGFFS